MRLKPAEFRILQHLRATTPMLSDRPLVIHLMLSGGKDSIALLEILHNIHRLPQKWTHLQLQIILHHFNHKRRGGESDQDEVLCADLARSLGLPIVLHRWGESLEDKLIAGLNFHAVARDWRYQKVRSFAERMECFQNQGNWVITTAHHRRDHAETLLHNLVRGCGIEALQSMSPWSAEQRLLRPLLWLTINKLDDYIAGKSFAHREDSSNQSLNYTRNRMRNIVLAELEQINQQAVEHIWMVSQDLRTQKPEGILERRDENHIPKDDSGSPRKYIELHRLSGIPDLRTFLLTADPELASQLTRKKLTNLLSHVRKLVANQGQGEEYKIALSERRIVTLNSKHLEIKVTSEEFTDQPRPHKRALT